MKNEDQTDYDWKSSCVYQFILVVSWIGDECVESIEDVQIYSIVIYYTDNLICGCSEQYLLFSHSLRVSIFSNHSSFKPFL